VLGPLIVSAAAVAMPDQLADRCIWSLLSPAVSRRPGRRSSAVAIGDSKRLYSSRRKNRLKHLERGVLAMLATRGRKPSTLAGLLSVLAPRAAQQTSEYPWYESLDLPLPRDVSATDVLLLGNSLAAAMAKHKMQLLAMRSEPVFVGEYNRLVSASRNKAAVLMDVTMRLVMDLWRRREATRIRIYIDRHGGRIRYLPALQRVFPGAQLKILQEDDSCSAYRLETARHAGRIQFVTGGEDRCLPVALASMTSKYLRELFMVLINRFWSAHVPGLKPTAGYYVDGRRFHREIQPAMRPLALDNNLVYRSR